jgi:hypothetical protein
MVCPTCGLDNETGESKLSKRVAEFSHGRLRVYECGGKSLFPVYGMSGGLAAQYVFYLYDGNEIGKKEYRVLCVRLPHLTDDIEKGTERAARLAVERFDELSHVIQDGGDMGLQGLDLREEVGACRE